MPRPAAAAWSCGTLQYATVGGTDLIANGGFESDLSGWFVPGGVLPPAISTTVVHAGAKSARVDAVDGTPTHADQWTVSPPSTFVLAHWFYASTWGPGGHFSALLLANWDPGTGAADVATGIRFFPPGPTLRWDAWVPNGGGGGVSQTLPNLSAGIWHLLEVVVDRTQGLQCLFVDGAPAASASVPPASTFDPEVLIVGDTSMAGDAGIAYYDDVSLLRAVGSGPDYVPANPAPSASVPIGESLPLSLSLEVRNQGNASAGAAATLAFYNESTPGSPFATFVVPALAAGASAGPFTATWMSPAAPGTYRVVGDVDYAGAVPEVDESNNLYVWTATVYPPPITTLGVGAPSYGSYVTSATPLTLSAQDRSGTGIARTQVRVDGGGWRDYAGAFTLAGEGDHLVEWFSEDNVGNVEAIQGATLTVDDTPPQVELLTGTPNYVSAGDTWVTSAAQFGLGALDAGVNPVGVATLEYRLGFRGSWSAWTPYASPFTLSGEGRHDLEYRSADRLGNAIAANASRIVDDTPPTTTLASDPAPLSVDATFRLSATDAGSGVASIEYRIDGGEWRPYGGPFSLPIGAHTIGYRATDRLGNPEPEGIATVVVENWKPIVAFLFAVVLAFLAVALAVRRRKAGAAGWRAVLVAGIAFAAIEAATGAVSARTGALPIPPLFGLGTIVDGAILAAGIVVIVLVFRRAKPAGLADSPER